MSKARERMAMLRNARCKGTNPRLRGAVEHMNTQDAAMNQEIYQDMFKGVKGEKNQKSMVRFCDKMSGKNCKNPLEPPKTAVVVDPETVYRPNATPGVKKKSFAKIGAVDVKLQDIVRVQLGEKKPTVQTTSQPIIKNAPLDRSRFAIENLFRPARNSPVTYAGLTARLQALEGLKGHRDLTTELQHALFFSTSADWIVSITNVKIKPWTHKDELALQRMLLPVFCWLQKLNKRASYVLGALKTVLHEFGIIQEREENVGEALFVLHFSCFSSDGSRKFDFLSLHVTVS